MHTPGLELSNIALKEPHFLPEPNDPNFNFQLEPITHKPKKYNLVEQKMIQRQKQLKQRKQLIENSQRARKQLLLQKIAAKNQKFQQRKKAQKQNLKSTQIPCITKAKNKLDAQNFQLPQKAKQINNQNRFEGKDVKKIYVNQQKVPFCSTRGFSMDKRNCQIMRKTCNQQVQSQKYEEIKVRVLKLPELNCRVEKGQNMAGDQNKYDQAQLQEFIKKSKQARDQAIDPLLKVHETRYFGIEENIEDYEKMGRSLLKQIKNRYWYYDSLEAEEVYSNFEELLLDQIA